MLWRDPFYLWLLPVIVAVGGVLLVLLRRRAVALQAFAEAPLLERLTPELDRRRPLWRTLLRILALAMLVVSLAGPKWGFHWQEVKREGIDLIVALDTSRSMLATDVKPDRLERAKLAVLDLLPRLNGDRIGLVAFAGTAFLECPLTVDYAAFERSLRGVEVGIIPRGGTALARAIDTSLEGFDARQGKYEALILITDGEDHEGDVKAATQRALDHGVKIYTVGIGTPEGELIPSPDGGFVKDRSGQVVKSRLDDAPLKEIALATGGAYVQGLGPSLGLDQVFDDHIAKMERREVASALERRYEERFQWPLAAALVLLAVEALVPLRRAPRRSWRRTAAVASTALCLPLLFGFFDPPGDRAAEGNQLYADGQYEDAASKYGEGLIDAPASPLLEFNLATALYKQGKYDDALAQLNKLAANGDASWTAAAAYNMGNIHYRLGAAVEASNPQQALQSWGQALADYKRAMVANAADSDAKFNHELVSRKIDELQKKLDDERKKKEEEQKEKEKQQQEQQNQSKQDQPQDQPKQPDQKDQQEKQDQQQQQDQGQDQQQQQKGEDQGKDEQQQGGEEQQDQQQAGGQQPDDQQQQQQPQDQAAQQDQNAQAHQPQQVQGDATGQPQAGQAGEGATVDGETDDPNKQAARAVLDTARGEELSPEDIKRPAGVAGVGEAGQDW